MRNRLVRIALATLALSLLLGLTVRSASLSPLAPKSAEALPVVTASSPVPAEREPASNTKLPARRVPGKPHLTLAVKPGHGFSALSLMRDGRMLLSCRPDSASQAVGVCLLARAADGESFTETAVVDAAQRGPISSAQGDGTFAVYAQLAAPQRILARDLASGEEREVGRLTAGVSRSPLGPIFAVDRGRVAWVDAPRTDERDQPSRIRIFDLARHSEEVIPAPAGRGELDGLALSAGELVVSRVAMDEIDARGEVHRYALPFGPWQRLSGSEAASMPAVAGQQVVWKRANHFSYGEIHWQDLLSKRGGTLSGIASRPSSDQPSIGELGATWLTAGQAKVEFYRFSSGSRETFDERGGRATTAGHYLAWVSDSASERGDFHVLWSDLSAPAR